MKQKTDHAINPSTMKYHLYLIAVSRKTFMKYLSIVRFGCSVIAFQAGSLVAQAQIFTLSDNSATADVNVGSSSGMFNWTVMGQDQLFQQWFWYRVGASGPEAPINTISPALAVATNGTRGLSTTYSQAQFSVGVEYLLTGGLLGGKKSTIAETITIHNSSLSTLDFHFFQYSDFDLGGSTGGDSVVIGKNAFTGLYNSADQFDPLHTFQESVVSPGANHAEVGFYPSTLNKLNDLNADTLNDVTSLTGPGDVDWAFEWDFSIAPGESTVINKSKSVELIPEPTSMALLVSAAAFCTMRRIRRRIF